MHHQAMTARGAAVPRSPAATHRPLPRPSESPAATHRPLPRPPPSAESPAATHGPLPRPLPSAESPASTHRPLPRPTPAATHRPLPRPPVPTSRPPPAPYHSDPSAPAGAGRGRASSALASCLAATAFLLLAAGGAGAALFLLFRPHPPDIAVAAVRLPAFAAANGTVAFTFEQTAVVRNPNRSPLAHFDSSLRVAYAGVGELGYAYIPAGLIDGGRAKDMSASFDVPAFPTTQQQQVMMAADTVIMEVESLLVVKGRVTMLRVLTHRVQAAKVCRVGVSPIDGRVLGFRC